MTTERLWITWAVWGGRLRPYSVGMPPLERVRPVYDMVAEDYAALLPDLRAEQPLDVAMIDEFARCVTENDPATVLDAGCGTGRLSGYLAQRGCRVTGIDISPGMIGVAQRTHGGSFEVGDLADPPGSDWAGIVAWYSLIHTATADLAAIFSGFHRVLRPDGPLLLGFQCGSGTRSIAHAYGHDVDMTAELHEPDAVSAMLTSEGFSVTAVLTRNPGASFERHPQAAVLARRLR